MSSARSNSVTSLTSSSSSIPHAKDCTHQTMETPSGILPCHMCVWVMSHVYELCHMGISHVTCVWVMSHVCMSYVTCVWVMSHGYKSCHMGMSYVTCVYELCHQCMSHVTCVWVMSHGYKSLRICKSHVTREWVLFRALLCLPLMHHTHQDYTNKSM